MTVYLNDSEIGDEIAIDALTVTDSETAQADSLIISIRGAGFIPKTVRVTDGALDTGNLRTLRAEQTRERTYLTAGAMPVGARAERYQVWEDVSLFRLVSEIASRLSCEARVYELPDVSYRWVRQDGESDCAFLRRRLALEGCHLKTAPGLLIAYDAKTFDAKQAIRTFDLTGIPYRRIAKGYQMRSGATVRCGSVSGRFSCDLVGDPLLFTNVPAVSIAEAQRFARGLLRNANEGAESLSFTVPLDTEIAAGCVFSALSENWVAARVTHDIVNKTSQIEGRAPLLW